MKMKMPKNKKEIMILVGSVALSMAAGMVVGYLKEKMSNSCYCVIDEM